MLGHTTPTTAHDTGLLTAKQVAALLQISVRTLHRNRAGGMMPPPTYIGPRAPRWNREHITAWIKAGGFNALRMVGGAA